MAETLFDPSWYRVASLKPRVRAHAELHRHYYRGELWYVLQDHTSGRFHRFSPAAYLMIGLMNGRRSVQEIWDLAVERLGEEVPTQSETIRLLGHLHSADVLQCDVPPDTSELLNRYERQQRSRWKQNLRTPLALRFPLLDPDRYLIQTQALGRLMFGWFGALVWLGVVGTAIVLAGAHWTDLTKNVADRVLAPQNLALLWLTFPVVKILHEFGHAYATRRWGGEVHEMGLMLLVFMPIPYVDASTSSAFRERYRRAIVGAAGMLVEVFVAAIAFFFWLNIEPGLTRAMLYNVMLIASVSTVLFNANPLLRFDGYYILADLVEIPNLATRSVRYLGYLIQRYVFGVNDLESPATTRGERPWFVFYAIAAFIYRMTVYFVIILFIAGKFFIVGVLLAMWAAFSMIVAPLAKNIWFLFTSPRIGRKRPRALATTGLALAAVLGGIFLVPAPMFTQSEGVIWVPDRSVLRMGADGFVRKVLAEPGSQVEAGDPLIRCEDPLLASRTRVLEYRLEELRARRRALRLKDRVEAQIVEREIERVRGELADARRRARELIVRAPVSGQFLISQVEDLPGRFVRKGERVGYVAKLSPATVRVVVPQSDVDLVRSRTRAVQVRLAGRLADSVPATIQREVPAATNELPSPALGSPGGGDIAVDPRAREGQGAKTLKTLFQFDLRLSDSVDVSRVGSRVHVRFDHGREPLGIQWYRSLRQLFLRRFDV